MVTDPPYGVEYDPTYRSKNRTGVVENDDSANWLDAYNLFPGTVAYIWHASIHVATVADDIMEAGFDLRSYLKWTKPKTTEPAAEEDKEITRKAGRNRKAVKKPKSK